MSSRTTCVPSPVTCTSICSHDLQSAIQLRQPDRAGPIVFDGQITQMVDGISGETVSYAYDPLKRLISASSAPTSGSTPTPWTQTFGYDGFGNMTSKTLNGGANMAPAVNPTTNRLTSGYDANGNMLTGFGLTLTYDGRNRVASATPTYEFRIIGSGRFSDALQRGALRFAMRWP